MCVNIYILVLLIFDVFNIVDLQELPFPNLTDFSPSDIGKPIRIFDGIDYDQLPETIKNEYNDCYFEHYRCVRFRQIIHPVCGYDLRIKKFKSYYSQCELNLQNCHAMVQANKGMYGGVLSDRIVFFVGEGARCEHKVL